MLERAPSEFALIIEEAIESFQRQAHAKSVEIVADLEPNIVVAVDPLRFRQIVGNLVANALKFTPSGGHMSLTLRRERGHAIVTVTDTGEGIPSDVLPYVFERFRQADSSTTRRHGGLGLGRAIVKHLVELHGGTVRVASRGTGHGADFTVALPIV